MDWGQPQNIIWMLLMPIVIGLSVYVFRWRTRTRKRFADKKLRNRIFPSQSNRRYQIKVLLACLGIFFAVLALMDPLAGEEEVKIQREGIDVVYALDLSNSMYADDVAPNRLERAKKIIDESLNQLGGDRVGLIVFAADAYSIAPLTTDYSAIRSYVESAYPELIYNQGTSFSDVVRTAAEMFKNTANTGRLLVILSDGEDNENSISRAVKTAKENDIHILAMGIGTERGAPIRMEVGGYEEFKMDKYGNTVISKFSEKSMKELASGSSGKYLSANQTQEAVEGLTDYMRTFSREVSETAFSTDRKHIYQLFLALALLFIFMDTLTSPHQKFNK